MLYLDYFMKGSIISQRPMERNGNGKEKERKPRSLCKGV